MRARRSSSIGVAAARALHPRPRGGALPAASRAAALNDAVGRAIGMAGAISMCTYRVIHRLHHNNLYTDEDPDTAIHGGYPRGTAYLWKKLAPGRDRLERVEDLRLLLRRAGAQRRDAARRPAARRHLAAAAPRGARSTAGSWSPSSCSRRWPASRSAAGAALAQYAAFWLVPMLTVLQPILRLRAICEHGAVSDFSSPLTAARSNRTGGGVVNVLGRALLFPHHVNYHLEHHLYPGRPALPPAAPAPAARREGRARRRRGARPRRRRSASIFAPRARALRTARAGMSDSSCITTRPRRSRRRCASSSA